VVFNGPMPDRRHGLVTSGTPGGVTNAQGIVNVTYTAPAVPAAVAPAAPVLPKDRIAFSVQADFDSDASFAPPAKGDGLETTVTQLYLYALRGTNKTWVGAGTNLGAIVSATVEIDVKAA
jgi:hypothetical protein